MVEDHDDANSYMRAPSNSFELNEGIDESKLNDAEKKMLADLGLAGKAKKDEDAFPSSVVGTVEPEKHVAESVTLSPVDSDQGKSAEPVASLPEDVPVPKMEVEIGDEPVPLPPLLDEDEEPDIPEEMSAEGDTSQESFDAGSSAPLKECPHCGWDMSLPVIAEPTYDEKMGFLHSVLGQKTFTHQYDMFGGKVVVRFRTLTTKEMDVVYNQVFLERDDGIITTIQDYWEKVNRYRLYLQLTYLAAVDGSFTYNLPDGYSEGTNPHALEHHDFKPSNPDRSYLPEIEQHILEEVLRTETIQRSVNTLCARFNRLVSKLEAMIDDSDFWEATKEQS